MNILFINVNYPYLYKGHGSFSPGLNQVMLKKVLSKPLNFPILSALTPNKHSVEIKDWCRYQDINFDGNYDLIGLSCSTQYAFDTYKIADEFQHRGKTVVLGGWHPTALPEEAKQHADSVVIGEAEETWPQLLKDFENGMIKPFYRPYKPVDPKHIPVLKNHSTKENPGIQATRGCPVGCEFCSVSNSKFRNELRTRPIENIIKEIKSMEKNYFAFFDNSLTMNPNHSKQLFREMKGLGKNFTCNGNINVLAKDEEFLRLAREAGCIGWLVGFESVSQKSLNETGKKTNRVEEYASAINKIHDYDMQVYGNFIFGFDSDTKDIFDNTYDVIISIGVDVPDIVILTPFPGTPLFTRLETEGRILTKDWSRYTFGDVVFQPKNMTPQELLKNSRRIYAKLYSNSNIFKRTIKSIKLGIVPFLQVGQKNLQYKDGFWH